MNGPRLVSELFPYVSVRLEIRGSSFEFEALLDTGFQGDIVIPEQFQPSDEAPDGTLRWQLLGGRAIFAAYYRGVAGLEGFDMRPAYITVLGDEPIVGVGLFRDLAVLLDHGRRVVVDP